MRKFIFEEPWKIQAKGYQTQSGFDFWHIFGDFYGIVATIPFVVALGLIAYNSFVRMKENRRLGFVGIASSAMFLVFAIYFFVIELWKKSSHGMGGAIVSNDYMVLVLLCELLTFLALVCFILIIVSFYLDDRRVQNLYSLFVRFFPYVLLLIVLSNVVLNMKFPLDPRHRARVDGFFWWFLIKFAGSRSPLYSPELLIIAPLALLISAIHFVRKNKNGIGLTFRMFITALIVAAGFYIEMFLHWIYYFRGVTFSCSGPHSSFTIYLTIMHFVFGMVTASWLIASRFKSPETDRFGKEVGIGILAGIVVVMLLIRIYIMNEIRMYH